MLQEGLLDAENELSDEKAGDCEEVLDMLPQELRMTVFRDAEPSVGECC